MNKLIANIEVQAKAQQLYLPFKYLNYAASFQDPMTGYGSTIKERLQNISRKYDPKGFFQTNVPGGFKLF